MTLTSQYAWLYNQYPFSNDPNAGLLHPDWWITECACVPGQPPRRRRPSPRRSGPNHFYDEQRLLLGQHVPGRRQGPADRPGRRRRRIDGHRPARLAARRPAAGRPGRGERAAVRRRPDRPARLGRRLRQGDRVRPADAPQGLRAAGHLPGEPAHHRRQRDDRGRRQLVHDHQGSPGRPAAPRPPTAPCTPASASTARTRRSAAATTSTCPASRSRATSASASTPTRSTASAGR